MRLLFLIENHEPHESGGGFYAIYKFAEFLAKNGHQILIYSVNDLKWVSESENLKILFRPKLSRKKRVSRKLDKYLENFLDDFLLTPKAKKFKPDWVFGILRESAIKAVKLADRCGAKSANFIYECPPWLKEIYGDEVYERESNAFIKKVWTDTRQAYIASDVLFPNSEESKNYNTQWLNSNNVADPIYPGIDHEQMPFSGPVYQTNSTKKNVLFLGRLVTEKNVHHLIEAWKSMPEDICLYIVGDGPLRETLESEARKASNNIIFLGFINDDELWSLFRKVDLLVCPSQFEGFGMPPMQALYFEKPALVSDLPIFHSIYKDHVDYFPLGDIDAIRQGVLKIINDKEYADTKSKAGREFVLQSFSWQKAADAIEHELTNYTDKS